MRDMYQICIRVIMLGVLIGLQLGGMTLVNAGSLVTTVDALEVSQIVNPDPEDDDLLGIVHVPSGTACPTSSFDSFSFDTSNISANLFAKHHALLMSALTTGEPLEFSYHVVDIFPPLSIHICYIDGITLTQ